MSQPIREKSTLVVSAHSADFVWRAGGAIALHVEQGYQVHIVCLSFGERGESAKLWRKGNMTEETVKHHRREEAQAAANILGASVEFFDIGDYPLRADKETLFRLADVYRRVQPRFVLTHSMQDPYNYDHPMASNLVSPRQKDTVRVNLSCRRRRSIVLSRISLNSAVGSRTSCWTSPASGRKSIRQSSACRARNTCGNTILAWRSSGACRLNVISASPPHVTSCMPKLSRASSLV